MAPSAIVAKLNAILDTPIDSECKVVYVACEVRKLMEARPTGVPNFALKMYLHWAIHVDLHGRDTISDFLGRVDEYVDGIIVGPEDLRKTDRIVRDFLSLDTFRAQLRDFFIANQIRTELTDGDERWNEFVKHYAGVIEDGSLSIHNNSIGLKHIKAVTFTKGNDAVGDFAKLPFDMKWQIALLDGRALDVDLNARPARDGVGEMARWGIHLRT